jgi:hypothetical protein
MRENCTTEIHRSKAPGVRNFTKYFSTNILPHKKAQKDTSEQFFTGFYLVKTSLRELNFRLEDKVSKPIMQVQNISLFI